MAPVGAVRLAHGVQQHLAAVLDGIARDHLLAAAAGGPAVGRQGGVVHHQADALRGEAQGTQGLVGGPQDPHVGPLAVVLPGGIEGHAVVGIELHPDLRAVRPVQAAAVDPQGDADTLLDLGGGLPLGPRAGGVVEGPQLGDHVGEAEDFGGLPGGGGAAGAVDVAGPDFQGIHAHLGGQRVHQAFAGQKALGGAVGPESRAPGVVGAHRAPLAADVGDPVAGPDELGPPEGEQVPEFRIGAVVDAEVGLHGHYPALGVGAVADGHPEGGALARVGEVLVIVVAQVDRPSGGHGGHPQEGFHGGAELVAESAAGRVLDQAQLFRRDPQAGGDHGVVQVDADALGVDGEALVVVEVGEAHIGFHGQVGLALEVVAAFHHVGRGLHQGCGVLPLDHGDFEVDVGGAGVDLQGVLRHGRRRAHVGRKLLQLHHDLLGSGPGLVLVFGADDGQGVPVLEDLGVAEDRPVPAVPGVGGEGDQAGDAVLALDVLVGDHLEDPGHLFRGGGVDALDRGMGHPGLDQGQVEGLGGQLQAQVGPVVQGPGDLGHGAGAGVLAAPDGAIGGQLEHQVFGLQFPPQDPGAIHHGIHQGFVAGAAAGVAVALEPVPHRFPGGVGVFREQGLGRDDEARGAETALGPAVDDPGQLQGVEMVGVAEALDGGHRGPLADPGHLGHAGADQLVVQDHVAAPALALGAAELGAGEPQLLPQHVGQALVGRGDDQPLDAVDLDRALDHTVSLLGVRVLSAGGGRPAGRRPQEVSRCRNRTADSGIRGSRSRIRRAPGAGCPPGSPSRRPRAGAPPGRRCWSGSTSRTPAAPAREPRR